VLSHVVAYARSRSLFPQDQDATGWPDLDAYDDIRERLHEYNFEGPLDAWMSVVISSRLRRYWRDRQALSAGGGGFKSASERDTARAAGFPVARILHLSLDQPLGDDDRAVSEWLTHATPLVAETVEDAELSRIVAAEVKALASRGDPLLAEIWNAVVDRQMRLREAAECYGLTISQTHRRVERVRTHLKHSPQVRQWLERGG
jgi:hypothetical protein